MESNNGIKLNRRQRKWNKFGKYLVIAGAAAVAVCITFFLIRGGVNLPINKKESVANSSETNQSSETNTSKERTDNTSNTSSAQDLKLAGPLKLETFTSAETFKNSVFMGDTFINGLDDYNFIDEYYLFQASFFPSTSAIKYVSDVKEMNPSKVFVMLGTDDANMNTNVNASDVAENVTKVLSDLKSALPDAKIYAISETPITKEYEESGNAYYTQKTLDEINKIVAENSKNLGITYIDISDAFKVNGYLNEEYTSDGYHINQEYYPYVLNGIANLIK